MRLSDEQRRVLKYLGHRPRSSAQQMRTGARTIIALAKRGLIRVDTTLNNIAFPKYAPASITEEGVAAMKRRS